MKLNKKWAWIIGSLSLIAIAAIVIPVAVVFSQPSSPSSNSPVAPTAEKQVSHLEQDDRNAEVAWGDKAEKIMPPALKEEGYEASDYKPGVFVASSYELGKTEIGEGKASVTFKYEPVSSTGTILTVTYGLNVVKGVSKELINSTKATSIVFGATVLPELAVGFDQWAFDNGYGYRLSGADNPAYLKSDGSPLLASDLSSLAAGTTFKARYAVQFDNVHYNQYSLQDSAHYEVTYKVVPLALLAVTDGPASFEVTALVFGADFTVPSTTDLPDGTIAQHYKLKDASPTTRITGRRADTTASPAVGMPITPAQVKDYEPDTAFEVVFTFTPESANYSGSDYTYTKRYEVSPAQTEPPAADARNLATVSRSFGQVGNVSPPPPLYNGYQGRYNPDRSIVKVKSTVIKGNSPAVDTKVDWAAANTYNAGTTFTVTFDYVAKAGNAGETFSVTRDYVVTKQKLTPVSDKTHPADTSSYVFGTELTLVAPAPANALYTLTETAYYSGEAVAQSSLTDVASIKRMQAKQKFTVQWTYTLDNDNYEAASGSANDNSYTDTTTFVIASTEATYTGTLNYTPLATEYGSPAPSDFVPDTWTLPDPAANDGYVYDATKYVIEKMAKDGTGPAVGANADPTAVDTYGAGTTIRAEVAFTADTPNRQGVQIKAFKLLTVLPKPAVQPAQSSLTPTTVTYGTPQPEPTVAPATFIGFKAGVLIAGATAFTSLPASGVPTSLDDPVDWAAFSTYGVGTAVSVKWSYVPNPNYSGITAFELTQTYNVTVANAALPASADRTLPDVTFDFGTLVWTDAPANPNQGRYTGFVLTGVPKAKVTKVDNSALVDSDHVLPTVGDDVAWSEVRKYTFGTELVVTYNYVNDADHSDQIFTVTRKYTVNPPIPTTAPTKSAWFDLSDVRYKYIPEELTDQIPVPDKPTSSTPVPTSQELGGSGYDDGTYGKKMVTDQTGSLHTNRVDSPPKGTVLDWAQVATLNAGTTFSVEVIYKPLPNHAGSAVVFAKSYKVLPAAVYPENDLVIWPELNFLRKSSQAQRRSDIDSVESYYRRFISERQLQGHYDPDLYYIVDVQYYVGGISSSAQSVDRYRVAELGLGQHFFVKLTIRFNSNAKWNAYNPDGTSYYYRQYSITRT